MTIRRLLIALAVVLFQVAPAQAQAATYSDHWLEEESVLDAPEGWESPEYSVGTTEAPYDPYEEYQLELKMYDGDLLRERLWSNWDPTYVSLVGVAMIQPDIIHTPIANCAEVDFFVKKLLQDVVERFARTYSETQVYRIESRYRWMIDLENGLHEYLRDECYHGCHSDRFCAPYKAPYMRGYGVMGKDFITGVYLCKISHRGQTLRPGCHGPQGNQVFGQNGCPD